MRDFSGLDKDDVRRIALEARSAMTPGSLRRVSQAIAERITSLDEVARAATVHIYMAIPSRREIDTVPIISALRATGKQIVLPVVRNFDSPGGGMENRLWHNDRPLTINRWGVGEPLDGFPVPADEVDVIIAPAMALDVEGNRIGYGKGFYDSFLRTVRAPAIGIIAEACLFGRLPSEPHDVRVSIVVTEDRILRPSQP